LPSPCARPCACPRLALALALALALRSPLRLPSPGTSPRPRMRARHPSKTGRPKDQSSEELVFAPSGLRRMRCRERGGHASAASAAAWPTLETRVRVPSSATSASHARPEAGPEVPRQPPCFLCSARVAAACTTHRRGPAACARRRSLALPHERPWCSESPEHAEPGSPVRLGPHGRAASLSLLLRVLARDAPFGTTTRSRVEAPRASRARMRSGPPASSRGPCA